MILQGASFRGRRRAAALHLENSIPHSFGTSKRKMTSRDNFIAGGPGFDIFWHSQPYPT